MSAQQAQTGTTAIDLDARAASFARLLGLRFLEAGPDCVIAEIEPASEHTSRPGIVHGGFLMGIADEVGGFATRINLKPGQRTTTIESKTNFLRAAAPGSKLRIRAGAVHKGRTTMVWQTVIHDSENRQISVTTQTQLLFSSEN